MSAWRWNTAILVCAANGHPACCPSQRQAGRTRWKPAIQRPRHLFDAPPSLADSTGLGWTFIVFRSLRSSVGPLCRVGSLFVLFCVAKKTYDQGTFAFRRYGYENRHRTHRHRPCRRHSIRLHHPCRRFRRASRRTPRPFRQGEHRERRLGGRPRILAPRGIRFDLHLHPPMIPK